MALSSVSEICCLCVHCILIPVSIVTNAGEAAVTDAAYVMFNSTVAQLAQRLGGIFVYMEHRFYGASGPNVSNQCVGINILIADLFHTGL